MNIPNEYLSKTEDVADKVNCFLFKSIVFVEFVIFYHKKINFLTEM